MTAPAPVFQYFGIFKPQNARKTSFALVDKRGIFRGMPDKIRTCDLQSRSLTLYPAELRAHMSNGAYYTKYLGRCQTFQNEKQEDYWRKTGGLKQIFVFNS